MEVKVNALVVKTVDYKDSDKILTLYSLEKGKITAGIKGVRKSGAKLKFASEPFCFAEYILNEKNGRYTVIGASYIDSFYELRLNLEKYYLSAIIGEFLNLFTEEEMQDTELFDLSINAIKNICYNSLERVHLADFLYRAIKILGYGIDDTSCCFCGEKIKGRVAFRYKDASFSCYNCSEEGFSEIRSETYNALQAIENNDFESEYLTDDATYKLLRFLLYYLQVKTDVKLKSSEALEKVV
jgi:DNA repair protein RecO (recombination protein O)